MDELMHRYSYFSAFEPYFNWYSEPVINGGLSASSPQNPLVIEIFENYFKAFTEG